MTETKHLYRIRFITHKDIYEIYAKYISHENLMGFLEIEELVFERKDSTLVIDPSIERLKTEFAGVKALYIPLHQIIRIDVVEQIGTAKITDLGKEGNVMPFPSPIYTPRPRYQE